MHIPRREFLKQSTLYAFSVSAFGLVRCREKPETIVETSCRTSDDILGPYYRANAPFRTDLTIIGQSIPPLLVKGTVYGADCTNPLTNAVIEYWQADSEGVYDNTSHEFRFRGQFRTGSDGLYAFKTIVPGRYLNGSTCRPSHIHFRVTAPGYRELVSQVYFQNDPYIDTDPWASNPAAKTRILVVENEADGLQAVNFPIYMSKS